MPPTLSSTTETSLPAIIGIGASAGGLEALERFLSHIPVGSGLAVVVIQHRDPAYKGLLPELLQRVTYMKVAQAGNHMPIKPDCVYVIPANKDLSLLHGKLHLLDPIAPRGLRLPIDIFFRALAEDQRDRAIGVILSGMGSDGTLGLHAIKENAGLSLVQDPATAKFDAMPRSAIDAGLADIVAPAEELPARIMAYLKHAPQGMLADPGPILELKSQSALEEIIVLLRGRTGNDFSQYKKNTLYRRIERRMRLHQIDAIASYVHYLRENSQELDLLFKELLIGVTNFFRDPAVWETLKTTTIPALLAENPGGKAMRAWVPACSTGEEAYSLAIVFKEALEAIRPQGRFSLQIFATDLDEDAITKARIGLFPGNIATDVGAARLSRFFVAEDNGQYRISKEIREMVIFASQNIIMDPPFTRLDIISCRNLLIYLNAELPKKLIPLFHYALLSKGILILGNSETIGSSTQFFTVLDNKGRLYQRMDIPFAQMEVDFPTRYFNMSPPTMAEECKMLSPEFSLQALADQLLLQHFAPAAVLINANGDILYINGRTGKYLEPASGKANWNIHAMAREGLRHELASALKKAVQKKEPVTVEGLKVDSHTVNLTVQPIDKPGPLRGHVIVVFNDVLTVSTGKTLHRASGATQKALLAELQQAREEIQSLREEMQTSQEKLKSANEELQSTNEELQSTNEELTISKEELQSLNEELHTVNAELQSKVEDVSSINNDMKNLLNSTEIATVFLDNALHVRRFTTHSTHLFKLIPSDVGRPLSDIVTELDYPSLQQDAQEVLRSLVFVEKLVSARNGRCFKVRIMPYRTQNNIIAGVVMTFIDISDLKALEAKLHDVSDLLPSNEIGGRNG